MRGKKTRMCKWESTLLLVFSFVPLVTDYILYLLLLELDNILRSLFIILSLFCLCLKHEKNVYYFQFFYLKQKEKSVLQLVWIEYWAHGFEWQVMDRWRDQQFTFRKTHLIVSCSQLEATAVVDMSCASFLNRPCLSILLRNFISPAAQS